MVFVTFLCWEPGKSQRPLVNSSAEIVTATQGTWRYLVVAADFVNDKEYYVAVRATKAGAQETTENYTLEVNESP